MPEFRQLEKMMVALKQIDPAIVNAFSENAEIRFDTHGDFTNHKIAPLILVTFFENSFKHGVSGKAKGAYAHFDLTLKDDKLTLLAVNSKGHKNNTPTEGGIGLENVKKRLSLIYPGKHSLEILETQKEFTINLTLEL